MVPAGEGDFLTFKPVGDGDPHRIEMKATNAVDITCKSTPEVVRRVKITCKREEMTLEIICEPS